MSRLTHASPLSPSTLSPPSWRTGATFSASPLPPLVSDLLMLDSESGEGSGVGANVSLIVVKPKLIAR